MTEPARNLQDVATALAGLTAEEYEDLLARSAREFAASEGQPEPLRAYRFDGPPVRSTAET